jgi:hypothetical protein
LNHTTEKGSNRELVRVIIPMSSRLVCSPALNEALPSQRKQSCIHWPRLQISLLSNSATIMNAVGLADRLRGALSDHRRPTACLHPTPSDGLGNPYSRPVSILNAKSQWLNSQNMVQVRSQELPLNLAPQRYRSNAASSFAPSDLDRKDVYHSVPISASPFVIPVKTATYSALMH